MKDVSARCGARRGRKNTHQPLVWLTAVFASIFKLRNKDLRDFPSKQPLLCHSFVFYLCCFCRAACCRNSCRCSNSLFFASDTKAQLLALLKIILYVKYECDIRQRPLSMTECSLRIFCASIYEMSARQMHGGHLTNNTHIQYWCYNGRSFFSGTPLWENVMPYNLSRENENFLINRFP